jgi:hypothetical protein
MTKEEAAALVESKVVHRLDYNDFDRIVQEVYGQDYEFVADEEAGNYQAKTYKNVRKDEPNYRYNWEKDLEKFRNTGKYFMLAGTLLYDLVINDYLPEGDYVIDIAW